MDIFVAWSEQTKTEAHSSYDDIYGNIFMRHVHESNFSNLLDTLKKFESVELIQESLKNRGLSKTDFLNVTGLFINYMSSAIALRDCSRVITKRKKLFDEELSKTSREMIAQVLVPHPQIKVIEDLRNIIMHQSVLIPFLSFQFKHEKLETGYAFDVRKLLAYDRLSVVTVDYLKSLNNNYLYLRPLVESYHEMAIFYQDWLINAVLNKHRTDNEIYWSVREKVSSEWGGDLEPIRKNNLYN